MGRTFTSEQRSRVEPGFVARRGYLFRIARTHAWAAAAVGITFCALLDVATGDKFWMGPLYLCFIGLAAWALGLKEALACFAVALIVGGIANSDSVYPYQTPISPWDYALRIPPVLAMILLLVHARNSCEREWSLARTDPLTGALNRKAFFELIASLDQSKHWHLLAYSDLDGFKRLNDEYGHARGDECLRTFAARVSKAIRKDDIFARIGGDEFLVYLSVRDEASGKAVAKRLHHAMNASLETAEEGPACSVGALLLAPGPRSINRELRCADALMYDAKRHGGALALATGRDQDGQLALSAISLLPREAATPAPPLPGLAEMERLGQRVLRKGIGGRSSKEAA